MRAHYYVTFGFMTPSALNVVTAWPGRVAFFGFGFFIYMTVATYAANLAGARFLLCNRCHPRVFCVLEPSDGSPAFPAFMVTKSKPSGYIKVLKDVQAKAGAKICLLEAMSGMQCSLKRQSHCHGVAHTSVCFVCTREGALFF